jgi:hypothetical protein
MTTRSTASPSSLRRIFGSAWRKLHQLWSATECQSGQRGRRLGRLHQLEDRYLPSVTPLAAAFQVNSAPTTGQQVASPGPPQQGTPEAVAAAANGNFVVLWSSNSPGTVGWDVYARLFNAAGAPLGAPFLVNTYTTNDQNNATVAMNAAGNFVIAWQSNNEDGSGWGIYAQRYNAAGVPQGGEFFVCSFTQYRQEYPSVAMDNAGDFVITWSSQNQDGNGWGIFAQRFSAAGVAQGAEFQVNTYTQNDQIYSSVAMDAAGDFVITWQSNNEDGSGWGIYAQRYNAAGVPQGGEFFVCSFTQYQQEYPSVAMDSAGDFVITWSSQNQDGSGWGIFAQLYNAAGVPQGSEFQVNTYTQNDQEYSAVAFDPAGNFLITWSSHGEAGSNWGVYGQSYSAAGAPLGGEFLINYVNGTDNEFPSVASGSAGTYVVAWDGIGGPPTSQGVFAEILQSSEVAVSPTSGLTTTTGGGTASFNVVLTAPPADNVTVPISSSDPLLGTPSVSALTFTPTDWNTPQTVTVTGVVDNVVIGNSTYEVNIGPAVSTDPNYSGLTSPAVSLTNLETMSAGVIVTPTTGLTTTDTGGTATFNVALTSQPVANVTVPVSSSDITEGTTSVAALTFTPGNWNVPQTVTITGQDPGPPVDTANNPYSIALGTTSSTDPNYSGINPSSVAVTNAVNATVGVTVTPTSPPTTTTAGGTATFTVALNSAPAADVTVPVTSSDPSAGTTSVTSLTFTPTTWSTPQTVTVTGVGDGIVTDNTPYSIVLGPTSSTDNTYDGLTPPNVNLINIETLTAGVTVAPTSGLTTTTTGGSASFTVVLNNQPTADVTIPVVSSNPGLGTPSVAALTFTSANWNTPQTVTVTGVVNDLIVGDPSYSINLGPTSSDDTFYSGLTPSSVALTQINPAQALTTTTAGGSASFSVYLTAQPTADVIVPVASTNPSVGYTSVTSLTFTPGNWSTPQTVTVTGVVNDIVVGNTAYSIAVGPSSSADSYFNGLTAPNLNVINIETLTAGVTVAPTSGLTTTTAGGSASFTVVLNNQPTADVTIPVASSNPALGTSSVAALTFTIANWNTPQTVTVTGVVNDVVVGNLPYSINLGPTSSADTFYSGLTPSSVGVTNLETMSPGITVSPTSGLTTNDAGGTTSFSVVLTSQPTANVIIPVASSNPSVGDPSVTLLTFTPANWNNPQTVTVTGVVSAVASANTGYAIQFGPTVSADAQCQALVPSAVNITNLNENTASVKGIAGAGPGTFSLVLTSQPTANVVVELGAGNFGTAVLSESALTFSPENWNVPQSVTVTSAAAGSRVTVKATTVSADGNYNGLQAALSVAIPTSPVPVGTTVAVGLTVNEPGVAEPTTTAAATGVSVRISAGANSAFTAATGTGAAGTAVSVSAGDSAASASHAANSSGGDAGGSRSTAVAEAAEADAAATSNLSSARQWILAATTATRNGVGLDQALSAFGSPSIFDRPESESAFGDTSFLAGVSRDGRRFDNALAAAPLWQEFDADAEREAELEIPNHVGVIAVTGLLASAGYVLLNTRAGVWALSLLSSRPLWNDLDPLEIVCAWDKASEQQANNGAGQDETLLSLVEGGARGG